MVSSRELETQSGLVQASFFLAYWAGFRAVSVVPRGYDPAPSMRRSIEESTVLRRAGTASLRRAHRRSSAQTAYTIQHTPPSSVGAASTCFTQGQLTNWLDEL